MTVTVETTGGNVVVGSSSEMLVKVSIEVAVLVTYDVTIQSSPTATPIEELDDVVEEVLVNLPRSGH